MRENTMFFGSSWLTFEIINLVVALGIRIWKTKYEQIQSEKTEKLQFCYSNTKTLYNTATLGRIFFMLAVVLCLKITRVNRKNNTVKVTSLTSLKLMRWLSFYRHTDKIVLNVAYGALAHEDMQHSVVVDNFSPPDWSSQIISNYLEASLKNIYTRMDLFITKYVSILHSSQSSLWMKGCLHNESEVKIHWCQHKSNHNP